MNAEAQVQAPPAPSAEWLAYSIQESAEMLGVNYFSVYRLIQRGTAGVFDSGISGNARRQLFQRVPADSAGEIETVPRLARKIAGSAHGTVASAENRIGGSHVKAKWRNVSG